MPNMSPNLPSINFSNMEQWIPESDIDGVDAKETVASEAVNAELRNGFISNAFGVSDVPFSEAVSTQIEMQGYELLAATVFTHSTQGTYFFYVLWNEEASLSTRLKFYLDEEEVIIPEVDEYIERPQNINFNLVLDQLKINLNCSIQFTTGNRILGNLTLVYLSKKVEYSDTIYHDIGWYLTPRYIGRTYTGMFEPVNNVSGFYLWHEDFMDGVIDLPLTHNFDILDPLLGLRVDTDNEIVGRECYISIENIRNLSAIKLQAYSYIGNSTEPITVLVTIQKPDNTFTRIGRGDFGLSNNETVDCEIILDKFYKEIKKIVLIFSLPRRTGTFSNTLGLKNLTLEGSKYCITALTNDGQREILTTGRIMNIYGIKGISFPSVCIDWRIKEYELYVLLHDEIYYKLASIIIDKTRITGTTILTLEGIIWEEDNDNNIIASKTLNFNYNLPFDAFTAWERQIHKEVIFKGRVYFINGDNRVYQSHLAGNGSILPDSFPYNEEQSFGYFIVARGIKTKVLFVSPTEQLVIITDKGIHPYYTESGIKQIRLLNKNISISSKASLTTDITGEASTEGTYWCDENGIYLFVGGWTQPKNLILGKLEEYWKTILSSEKANAIGFYVPKHREYWLKLNNVVLVYETEYDSFKIRKDIKFPSQYMGVYGNEVYYINDFGTISKTSNTYSKLRVDTHYQAGEYSELYEGILQEAYLIFGDSDPSVILMTIYYDDLLLGSYQFNSKYRIQKWLMPLGIRFNRIKISLLQQTAGKVRIKQFGCTYTPDSKQPLGQFGWIDSSGGYGYDYGSYYGDGL